MISFGTGRKRTGIAQNVPPMLKKFRFVVERLVKRQFTSNRRHGGHQFASQSPGDAGEQANLPLRVRESLVDIAHFGKIMIAVCGCSKQTTGCGELPKVINTDHHQKPACAGCIGLRLRPRPPRGCRAQQITTASASPSWGRFFDIFDFGRSKFWSRVTMLSLISGGRWRWCWSRLRPRSDFIRPSNDPRYYWLPPRRRTPTQASRF
jgi:hypothetical protein